MRYIVSLLMIIIFPLSIYAAQVKFHKDLDQMTPEKKNIPLSNVPAFNVKPYKTDNIVIQKKVKHVFEKNPVSKNVRAGKIDKKESADAVSHKAGSVEFEVSKISGAERLIDLDKYTKSDKKVSDVGKEKIRGIAHQYVKDNMPDINPSEMEFKGIKTIVDSEGTLSKEGAVVSNVKHEVANYIAIFERKIGKTPVIGAGGSVRVYMSKNGDPIGHSKVWREIDKQPKFSKNAVPTSKIKEKFAAKHGKTNVKEVSANKLYFGYYEEGRNKKQDTLQPVYMVGYTTGPESKETYEMYNAYTGEEIQFPDPVGFSNRR